MIVVSDTMVINYLVLTGYVELLHDLFGRVILPEAVYGELTREKTPASVREWMAQKHDWLEVKPVETLLPLPGLHLGEQEAISLAVALGADALLIDERKGSRLAQAQGLSVLGTLNILEEAAYRNLVDLHEAIEKLKLTSFHITERVLEGILGRYEERQKAKLSASAEEPPTSPEPTPDRNSPLNGLSSSKI